jgi:hypothetical protein
MLSNRFLLSLVAALSLSTLASANSADVTRYLHSGAYTGTFSTVGVKTAPTTFLAYHSHRSTDALMNPGMDAAVSGKTIYGGGVAGPQAAGSVFPHRKYGPSCCLAREWVGSGRISGPPKFGLSTPEPNTLMLLSTGLLGIAGMVRRKLRLG